MKIKALLLTALCPFYLIAGEAKPLLEISELLTCPWAGEDKTICPGECVEIGCPDLEIQEDDICFSWVPSDGISDGYSSHGAVVEVCPIETTTYILYVTNIDGELIATDSVTVNVIPLEVKVNSSETGPICTGEVVTLIADVVAGNGGTYQWSTGETTSSINVSPDITTRYFVTVTDNQTGCEVQESHRIQVRYTPSITISRSIDAICDQSMEGIVRPAGQGLRTDCTDDYTILTVTYDPAYSYLWSTGEVGSLIRAYEVGTYSVTVTTPQGCQIVAFTEVNSCSPVEITPTIGIDESTGEPINLLSADDGFYAYQWSTGAATQTIEVDEPGLYQVTVTTEAGCSSINQIELVEEPEIFTNYLIFSAWDSNDSEQYFYISHPPQKSNGQAVEVNNEAINHLISTDNATFTKVITESDESYRFIWVCGNDPTCLAEHTNEHRIVRDTSFEFRFYSVVVDESNPLSPQIVRFYLDESSNYVAHRSIVEFPELSFSRTLDYTNNFKLSDEQGLPVESNYPEEINVTATVILGIWDGDSFIDQDLPEDISPQVSTMKIQFDNQEEETMPQYAISHLGSISGPEIEAPELSSVELGILRINEDGTTTPVEALGTLGVNQTSWSPPGLDNGTNVANFTVRAPQFSEDEESASTVTLTINDNIYLSVRIVAQDVPVVPGWHFANEIIAPQTNPDEPPKNTTDYIEKALTTINQYDTENEDYNTYSTIFGNNEMSVTFHLLPEMGARVSGTITLGRTTHEVFEITEPKSLRVRVPQENLIEIDGYECPTGGEYYKIISPSEKDSIITVINDGYPNDISPHPTVIDRIAEFNAEAANLLIQYCMLTPNFRTSGLVDILVQMKP